MGQGTPGSVRTGAAQVLTASTGLTRCPNAGTGLAHQTVNAAQEAQPAGPLIARAETARHVARIARWAAGCAASAIMPEVARHAQAAPVGLKFSRMQGEAAAKKEPTGGLTPLPRSVTSGFKQAWR
jgi:hypothetical protein